MNLMRHVLALLSMLPMLAQAQSAVPICSSLPVLLQDLQSASPAQFEAKSRALPQRDFCRADVLATYLKGAGDDVAGRRAIELALELEPCDTAVHAAVGEFHARAGEVQLALCFFDKALKFSRNETKRAALKARMTELSRALPSVPVEQIQCARVQGQRIATLCPVTRGIALVDDPVAASVALRVQFEFDSHRLTPAAQSELRQLAQALQSGQQPAASLGRAIRLAESAGDAVAPRLRISLTGHSDSRGSDRHNLELSRRRAQAVADLLQRQLPDAAFSVEGRGSSDPIYPAAQSDDEHLFNRRVELLIR